MFDFVAKKIDFDIIDFVKLRPTKIDFKLKCFMIGYIHAKMNLTKKLIVKINSRIRNYHF
jgi:hypothetical protein